MCFTSTAYSNLPGFADASAGRWSRQVLTEGAKFCEEVLAPLNHAGDQEGCVWSQDNTVKTPKGFKEAYKTMVEAGWPALGRGAGVRRPGPAPGAQPRL